MLLFNSTGIYVKYVPELNIINKPIKGIRSGCKIPDIIRDIDRTILRFIEN